MYNELMNGSMTLRISLTHEQADFDAVASLLGTFLVDKRTLPVLPRRLNRNVRSFLTLYGSEFPFVESRDLPNQHVKTVCIVDTQSAVSIRGVNEQTVFYVADHHALKQPLPESWHVTIDQTGANTTLFVETIRERDIALTSLQATLLLLGIYEDTGSLTYPSTTPRDVHAAAFLLEKKANLVILSRYLNQPLSEKQRVIYRNLLEHAKSYRIHGHDVVIASADARDSDEDLSSIVHKMRDLLDPDALFVLVRIRGGIQLIARSLSDRIDVSKIVSVFGGGGHLRAAAALIKQKQLDAVLTELLSQLHKHIVPAVTVAQIMSKKPLLITPEMTAREADFLMRKYGYEGYPVVEDNAVIGLLTRRAVDRALNHGINLTARSLMEAGGFAVKPGDSIGALQDLMIRSGWGQIPVVSEDGEIVGIVTRTDLIKFFGNHQTWEHSTNLSEKLACKLPSALLALLQAIADKATKQHAAIYLVGGFVRDLLLDKPGLDLDLVVEGNAIALGKELEREFGGKLVSHNRFGTAKWIINQPGLNVFSRLSAYTSRRSYSAECSSDTEKSTETLILPDSLDLISARTEFYAHPTALPTVEQGSIKLDLHRRDFTINTLAIRLDGQHFGELYDYWGGLQDLKKGVIRVLHSLSFIDDPTRMLRAVRYEQRYGFEIEYRTMRLIDDARALLRKVSGDRIRHEMDAIFLEKQSSSMVSRLNELALPAAIHPKMNFPESFPQVLQKLSSEKPESFWQIDKAWRGIPYKVAVSYLLWFGLYGNDGFEEVIKRLRIQKSLSTAIGLLRQAMNAIKQEGQNLKPSRFAMLMKKLPSIAVYACSLLVSEPWLQDYFMQYMKKWKSLKPNTTGTDLKRLGIPLGPEYKRILNALYCGWVDGVIHTREEENAFLRQILTSNENETDGTAD